MKFKFLFVLSILITLCTVHQGLENRMMTSDETMRGTDGLSPSKPSFCCRTNSSGEHCCCGTAGNMSPCYVQLSTCQDSCLI
ncbi:hypothetical protein ZOSMA_171G00030 [Zostera marina]|uniref:Uncharacterized protein n=1 Tax=Zostera marina TaxID=29655 RepID=A0A0K9PSG6_ZOSMR|nr:hypothetical protein ZOSMA_171G00030 [Zostera marina]